MEERKGLMKGIEMKSGEEVVKTLDMGVDSQNCREGFRVQFLVFIYTCKGNSYVITSSVINEALHLPNSSFENLPCDEDLLCMLKSINYASKRQMLEDAAKNKEKIYKDMKARHIQQEMSLSDVWEKLSGARENLSRAETYVESLKLKREELTGALLKLTEELSQEEKRVKTLAAERDHCKEAYSNVKAELKKLEAEKEEARVAFEASNDQYNAAKDEFERANSQLLQL